MSTHDDERWARTRACLREARRQWEIDHADEIAAEREQQKRKDEELAEERRQEDARTVRQRRVGNRRFALSLALYVGGSMVVGLIFSGTCPSCAWHAETIATWLDLLAMYCFLAWGLGGMPLSWWIADRLNTLTRSST